MKSFNKFAGFACAVLLGASIAQPASGLAINTDFIPVVDETWSMSTGTHKWLRSMATSLNTALRAAANTDPFNANYSLIGFGKSGSASGRSRWNSTRTRDTLKNAMTTSRSLLNAVVNCHFRDGNGHRALGIDWAGNAYVAGGSGGFIVTTGGVQDGRCRGTTEYDYVTLATAMGGSAWDINMLRLGRYTQSSLTAAFGDVKVRETIRFPSGDSRSIPEPNSMALFAVCLASLGLARRLARNDPC